MRIGIRCPWCGREFEVEVPEEFQFGAFDCPRCKRTLFADSEGRAVKAPRDLIPA